MNYNDHLITVAWVDLDDTLIDFTANAHRALCRLWREEQLLQRLFDTPDRWAELYERNNKALWDEYNVGNITRQHLRMERFRLPLTQAGLADNDARQASERYDTLYLDYLAQEKQLIPGATDLLKQLRSYGVTIGVLSNGFKEVQFRKIASAGLDPYIDIVVLSDDIGINKPDIRLYEHAMQRSGDNTPAHHLMIGDNPLTDIAGAVNAGWEAIWYRNGNNALAPHGSAAVSTLAEISAMLSD